MNNMLNVAEIARAYPDLTEDERQILVNIRKRKLELMQEISQLKEELTDVNVDIESMDTEEGARLKNLQMGKKKFNMDPKKGIEFLVSHQLLQETPEEVAQFLYKGEGLNKTMIGDYLGERSDFNEAVLKAFVELHDFTDLILVQALRYAVPIEVTYLNGPFNQCLNLLQAISLVVSSSRRGAEDRPHDGVLRAALLHPQPGHLHQLGHVLRPLLRHHHAQHEPAQPERQGQAVGGAVHLHEQRNQRRRRLAQGIVSGK